MLWILFVLMSLAAIAFTVWPLAREFERKRVLTVAAVVFVGAASAGLYSYTGSPDVPSGRSHTAEAADLRSMIEMLSARLERTPDDVSGWQMLGRSYMAVSDFAGAVEAFDRAVELESGQNPQTLVSLGVALAQADGTGIPARAIAAFENALAIDPNHPEALFYGGLSAANQGETDLAADRWETLLAGDPPEEVQNVLRQRIAEWRGEEASPPPLPEEAERPDTIVAASVTVSPDASASLPGNTTVFVIARDPAQPSPPIAVVRRQLSELPAVIELDDRNSMIPGRALSGFEEIELVARASASGSPVEQSGDWYGTMLVRPGENSSIDLAIDQRVE